MNNFKIVCPECEEEMNVTCACCSVPAFTGKMSDEDFETLHKRYGKDMGGLLHYFGVGDLSWDLILELIEREKIAYSIGFEKGKLQSDSE